MYASLQEGERTISRESGCCTEWLSIRVERAFDCDYYINNSSGTLILQKIIINNNNNKILISNK